MKKTILVVGILFLFAGLACGQKALTAHADLFNAKGEKVGSAKLTETNGAVKIVLEASNLQPGEHGFHIHAVGKCESPDFKSAGGHFNPFGKKHGMKSAEGHHAGDMPNLTVGSDGTVKAEAIASEVTLKEGKNSLFQAEGTALVIHASPDDEMTDPAGNAGARIVCGVITR